MDMILAPRIPMISSFFSVFHDSLYQREDKGVFLKGREDRLLVGEPIDRF
jgi:hypothetical protein